MAELFYVIGIEIKQWLEMGHNNFDDVLLIDKLVRPKHIILTHVGHDLDIWLIDNQDRIPPHMTVGKDGMTVFPMSP